MLGRVQWWHRDYGMKFDLLVKAAGVGAGLGAALMYVAMRRPKP